MKKDLIAFSVIALLMLVAFFTLSSLAKADPMPEEAPKCVRLCPNPSPKPRPKSVVKTVKAVPAPAKVEQEQHQSTDQKNQQTVNVKVYNQAMPVRGCGCSTGRCSRPNFRLGVHAGCGPVGVKSVYIDPTTLSYVPKSGLVIGGSASVRVLGPAWVTGQAFSNGMMTGGVELEF